MAADVARFASAIDKVYKMVSTQDVQFEAKEMRGLSDRDAKQYMERKFQQQLQRARAAFLQEFRNHSVVVECEVKKIRKELTEKMEEKYGERISQFKAEIVEANATISKLRDEIARLKSLVGAQESYITAVKQQNLLENKEKLKTDIAQLKEELAASKQEGADISQQLMFRDELVAQLNNELSSLEAQLKNQAAVFTDERTEHEEQIRSLKEEMQLQQEQFSSHLEAYEGRFQEYMAKTSAELQIQEILNSRRSEALHCMEEERQMHVKARTKPSARIGEDRGLDPHVQAKCTEYMLAPEARYRVDDMGMDTAWRDYELNDLQLVPPVKRAQPPKFRVDRIRKSAQRANTGPNAPTATETPRENPRPTPRLREITLPSLPAVG